MGDRLGIHGAAGLFWPFLAIDFFLQTPAKQITIILDILSRKKIGPRGDSNRVPLGLETDALSVWPRGHKVSRAFFGHRLLCRHLQNNLSSFLLFSAFSGLFLAFFGHRPFLQTPATKFTIILDVLSRKKIWPPGGLEPAIFGSGD